MMGFSIIEIALGIYAMAIVMYYTSQRNYIHQ